jgi:branched-chain amino acid transport system substrate-binding protein
MRWRAVPLAVLVAVVAFGACRPAPTVAVSAALSRPFVNATRLAIEDASAEGGLPGLDTLLLTEASNSAAPAIRMAEQFTTFPGMVAVIGHSNSSASLAASPIYNGAEIVQVAPTSTAARFAEAGPFSFRLVPSDHRQGEVLAREAAAITPGETRVALLFVNDDYGRGLRRAVLDGLDPARSTVVYDTPHSDIEPTEDTSQLPGRIAEEVAAIVGRQPDVLLWLGRAATLTRYLPELRRRLGAIPILGGDAVSPGLARAAQEPGWGGVRYTDFFDPRGSEELRTFGERFTARFGDPAGTAEILSYDAMRMVLAALASGARTGAEVREWLLALGHAQPAFQGLSGLIRFTADRSIERSYVLITIPGQP